MTSRSAQVSPLPRPFTTPKIGLAGLALGLLLTGCAATEVEQSELDVVRDLIRHGQFVEAVGQASQLAEDRPRDPEASLLHRDATVAYLVARGRQKTFEGRDDAAMEDFQEAKSLDPESRTAADWILKTDKKLADLWYERARNMHASDNLEGARMAYETALGHSPDHKGSREGLIRVGIQQNYREGQSENYYNEGLRAIGDWRLEEAKHRFQGSGKYGGQTERVVRRVSEVDRQLASQRVIVATQLETDGLHTAARNEYRVATIMDPENEAAEEGFARARNEAEVTRLLEEAKMHVLRGEFDRGRSVMEKAMEKTKTQSELITKALGKIDGARATEAYQAASDLEHDFRYEEAIAAYQHVIDTFGFVEEARDSVARISTLQDYVTDAKELYAEAKGAETAEARKDLLRQIEVFWPEYKDIQEQLEAISK